MDVMDLDEVYYDAGTCGRSYRENGAMLVKKRSSKMKLRDMWITAKEERKSQFVALFRRRY